MPARAHHLWDLKHLQVDRVRTELDCRLSSWYGRIAWCHEETQMMALESESYQSGNIGGLKSTIENWGHEAKAVMVAQRWSLIQMGR